LVLSCLSYNVDAMVWMTPQLVTCEDTREIDTHLRKNIKQATGTLIKFHREICA